MFQSDRPWSIVVVPFLNQRRRIPAAAARVCRLRRDVAFLLCRLDEGVVVSVLPSSVKRQQCMVYEKNGLSMVSVFVGTVCIYDPVKTHEHRFFPLL